MNADTGAAAPRVHVVAGAAGAGKSTVGRALARACGAVLLDQDVLTNPLMAELARVLGLAEHDLDHPALRGPVRRARYRCVLDAALDNVALGRSVVLVAPFTAELADPAAWDVTFGPFRPARVLLWWVWVPPGVAAQRRRRRAEPRDLAAVLDEGAEVVPPVRAHLRVDGTAPADLEVVRLLRDGKLDVGRG